MARLAEWREKVAECRSSGMSVIQWCQGQGVTAKTYYRWEREVLAEAGQTLVVQKRQESPAFVAVQAMEEERHPSGGESTGMVAARLHTAAGELDVYAGADQATLEAIIGALKDAE